VGGACQAEAPAGTPHGLEDAFLGQGLEDLGEVRARQLQMGSKVLGQTVRPVLRHGGQGPECVA